MAGTCVHAVCMLPLQVSKMEALGREGRVRHEQISMRTQMLEDQQSQFAQVGLFAHTWVRHNSGHSLALQGPLLGITWATLWQHVGRYCASHGQYVGHYCASHVQHVGHCWASHEHSVGHDMGHWQPTRYSVHVPSRARSCAPCTCEPDLIGMLLYLY